MYSNYFYLVIAATIAPSFDWAQSLFSSNFLTIQKLPKISKIEFIISIHTLIYYLKVHSLVYLFHSGILNSSLPAIHLFFECQILFLPQAICFFTIKESHFIFFHLKLI